MARDEGRRKSLFDDDEEEQETEAPFLGKKPAKGADGKGEKGKLFSGGPVDSQTIDLKLSETKALMEQTHQLYQHYFTGLELRPPIEKARLLESRIAEIQRINLSTPTAKFKIGQFILQYNSFRDLWDRKLRDKERA